MVGLERKIQSARKNIHRLQPAYEREGENKRGSRAFDRDKNVRQTLESMMTETAGGIRNTRQGDVSSVRTAGAA